MTLLRSLVDTQSGCAGRGVIAVKVVNDRDEVMTVFRV